MNECVYVCEVEYPFLQLIIVNRSNNLRFYFYSAISIDLGQTSYEKDCVELYELPEERRGYIVEATGNGAEV